MIWPFKTSNSPVQTTAPEVAAHAVLPDAHVWAARDCAGPVPQGWLGLLVNFEGEVVQRAEPGQTMPSSATRTGGCVVWWVRQTSWTVELVPWPKLAPQAAVQATVGLDLGSGVDVMPLLALQLAVCQHDVTAAGFALEWAGTNALTALPPCAQPHELQACARAWEHELWAKWGMKVKGLQRVDLPTQPSSLSAPLPQVPGPDSSVLEPDASPLQPEPLCVEPEAAPTMPLLHAQDVHVWAQVAKALPSLSVRLERLWAGPGWSQDLAVAAQQRNVVQRMGLMSAKLGVLPALAPAQAGAMLQTQVQQRLAWVHNTRALGALSALEVAVSSLQAQLPPQLYELQALEHALQALEEQVHARMNPWWRGCDV